jgi:hypothetical protein
MHAQPCAISPAHGAQQIGSHQRVRHLRCHWRAPIAQAAAQPEGGGGIVVAGAEDHVGAHVAHDIGKAEHRPIPRVAELVQHHIRWQFVRERAARIADHQRDPSSRLLPAGGHAHERTLHPTPLQCLGETQDVGCWRMRHGLADCLVKAQIAPR